VEQLLRCTTAAIEFASIIPPTSTGPVENKSEIRAYFSIRAERQSAIHVCHPFHHKLGTKNRSPAPNFPKTPFKNARKTRKSPGQSRGSSTKNFLN
jgi:hypothetical protein